MKDLKITKVQENPANSNESKDITAYMIDFTLHGVYCQTELIRHYEDDTYYLNFMDVDFDHLHELNDEEENRGELFGNLEDNEDFTLQLLVASASFENMEELDGVEFNYEPYTYPEVKIEAKRRLLTWVSAEAPDELIHMIWAMEGYKVEEQLTEDDYIK